MIKEMKKDKSAVVGEPEKESPENGELKNETTLDKISRYKTYITVEPLLACYVLPSVLASLAIQNLNLEKACRVNLNYDDNICSNLIEQNSSNKTNAEVESQILVAYMTSWRLPMQTAIPAIAILFIGAWSDKYGKRKPCMLVPFIGEFVSSFGLILCTYYFLQWPLEVAGVFEGLPSALSGGWPTMFMAIFSYLADNTKPEDRTFRIGIVNVIISIGIPVGTALSGIMLREFGYYGVFSTCMGVYIFGFLYGYVVIKDKEVETHINEENKSCCAKFIGWHFVYDTFMVIFKQRKLNRRLRTILLMVCYIIVSGPVHGTAPLIYLYARKNFGFNEVDFSLFSSYSIVINLLGVMIAITLFSKVLKIDDTLIGIMACISKIIACAVYAFATSKTWFYVGPAVELIGGTAVIAMRSIATKVVDVNEMGKINSIFGVCDAVINVIYTPIFATFYVHTIEDFAGAFCLLGGLLLLPSIGVFGYMYKLQKQDNVNEENAKTIEEIDNTIPQLEITSL